MPTKQDKKRALGRGLSALLDNSEVEYSNSVGAAPSAPVPTPTTAPAPAGVAEIAIAQIETNPFQPRDRFNEDALQELASSIAEHGIIQPITVRDMGYGKYQLISGERRFRASQRAGLSSVPAYVRLANDQSMLEMALVENIQREDLDAIEVATSYQRLLDECDLTQEELAKKVSKNRTTVTNFLRLLKLPAEIQLAIQQKKISMGHARALINVEEPALQKMLLKQILTDGLSVRKVEALVREGKVAPITKRRAKGHTLDDGQKRMKERLSEKLGVNVELRHKSTGKGHIVIPYYSDYELERLLNAMKA